MKKPLKKDRKPLVSLFEGITRLPDHLCISKEQATPSKATEQMRSPKKWKDVKGRDPKKVLKGLFKAVKAFLSKRLELFEGF